MKILVFTSIELAQEKINLLNANCNLSEANVSASIVSVCKRHEVNEWWFNRDVCENPSYANGGSGANSLLMDSWVTSGECEQREKTIQELKDETYFPPFKL